MIIFPAIDILSGRAVRLYKGDYSRVTDYGDPCEKAREFISLGARHIHIVDLDGARDGNTPNIKTVCRIKRETGAFCEVGGGIRSERVIEEYISAGIDRVILGTAAIRDDNLLRRAVSRYGGKIAVGADIKDGFAAVSGWLEKTDITAEELCERLEEIGVENAIVTDISKDGALRGTNLSLYRRLCGRFSLKFTASGGVSCIEDIKKLADMGLYAAIIGKAYYEGAIDLRRAIGESE